MVSFNPPYNLRGYLLEYPAGIIGRETIIIPNELNYAHNIPKTKNWELYDFICKDALMNEVEFKIDGPFHYPVFCRRSGQRALMLSIGRQIVEYLITNIYTMALKPNFNRVHIAVHDLVTHISNKPDRYVLTFVHSRVSGFGSTIKAASFYGEDVGEAELFRKNLNHFNCFTCGLRNITGGPELLRISSEGFISFKCLRPSRFSEVESVLGYIRDIGFLSGL